MRRDGFARRVLRYNRGMKLMTPQTPAEKLLVAMDLHDAGLAMKLAQLARAYPEASDDALEQKLNEWLESRARRKWAGVEGFVERDLRDFK